MNKVESCINQDISLESKIKMVFSPNAYTKTVSIGILIGAGSITEETEALMGYSHFLEHMIFKGTSRFDFEQINKEFEKMGAYVNAFTGKYYTLFYLHCLENFAKPCLELLLEMVFHSTLPQKEIEKEKKVIIEEIHTYKDSPEDYLLEEFSFHTFPKSFFGAPILGTTETIQAIHYESLNRYYKKYYTQENCIISVAGNFLQEEIEQTVENFFSSSVSQKTFHIKQKIPFSTQIQTHFKADLEQAHLCLGITTQQVQTSKHALKLFNIILGGISSSRLYLGVREKKALCYNVESSIYTDPNTSFINIFASTQARQIQDLVDAIQEELQSLNKRPISEEELFIAKNQMKSKIAFRQESISQMMMKGVAQVFFYGKIISDNWTLEKLDKIQLNDFIPIYQNLSPQQMSLHILTSTNTKKKITL